MAVDTPYFAVADEPARSRFRRSRRHLHVSRLASRRDDPDRHGHSIATRELEIDGHEDRSGSRRCLTACVPRARRRPVGDGRSGHHRRLHDRQSGRARDAGARLWRHTARTARPRRSRVGRTSETDESTDAFGAAYPYGNRVQVTEAYGERLFRPGPALVGFRAGRYRTPFGITREATTPTRDSSARR